MPKEIEPLQPDEVLKAATSSDTLGIRLLEGDIERLPLGYQTIYTRPKMPKALRDSLMIHNTAFHYKSTAAGSVKPISKIVGLEEKPESIDEES